MKTIKVQTYFHLLQSAVFWLGIGTGGLLPYLAFAQLSGQNNQLWHQNSPGIAGGAEHGDKFGSATASGDFNNDGFDDLAIGVPDEKFGGIDSAGVVHILYGGTAGLGSAGDQLWSQANLNNAYPEPYDGFGSALATGYFNNDPYADLVIGVPSEDIGNIWQAGAVHVLYGGPSGLSNHASQVWTQDGAIGVGDIASAPERRDFFGGSLSSGDFNNDGFSDLAIGVASEDLNGNTDAGAVNVIYGGPEGLSNIGNQLWTQDGAAGAGNIIGVPERLDRFGYSRPYKSGQKKSGSH